MTTTSLLIGLGAFVTVVTLLLYLIVIAIQGTAMVADCIARKSLPPRIGFSDVCQNLGVVLPIIGFMAGSRDLMTVGILMLALGIVVAGVTYRANRVVDISLNVTAILSILSIGTVNVIGSLA